MPGISTHALAKLYADAHNAMRNIDGMQAQEAFDELLKFLLVRTHLERQGRVCETEFTNRPPSLYVFNALLVESLDTRMLTSAAFLKFDRFLLSEKALQKLSQIFTGTRITSLPFDIRSEAIKEFMAPDLRKGLGMFLTPDPVVNLLIDLVQPKAGERILDPACGTGSFLLAAARSVAPKNRNNPALSIVGTDKNPRMILLSQMNFVDCDHVEFEGLLQDSLAVGPQNKLESQRGTFDLILTNPPFGVGVGNDQPWLANYSVAQVPGQSASGKIPSEVLFLERCLQMLRPGGRMGVVLPRSVMTNVQLAGARTALGNLGQVEAVVGLPPETFATTGTQTSTLILLVRKYSNADPDRDARSVAFAEVRNVGFDIAGRPRLGSELPDLPRQIRRALAHEEENGIARLSLPQPPTSTFSTASFLNSHARRRSIIKTIPLGEIVKGVGAGRTPKREEYTDAGVFLVKVGNLTGNGISWVPRDRNFLDRDAFLKLRNHAKHLLVPGDILLTASAHTPEYIARKVDIITSIPTHLETGAAFVGEVMRVQTEAARLDPFLLLAYLRMPSTTQRIQAMVRGQTAHLYADDLANLDVPACLLDSPPPELSRLAQIIREEAQLAEELNRVALAQERIFAVDRLEMI